MPPVEVPESAVRSLLARWFPEHVVAVERVGVGVSTPVYRVTVGADEYYLRLAEEPGERRDAEVRVHELVRDLGIAVPEILRWERDPPELDRSAALTARMAGVPLNEFDGDAADALRRAGRDLVRINATPVRGYGWVDFVGSDDRHLAAEHPARSAWAAEYLAALETVTAAGVFCAVSVGEDLVSCRGAAGSNRLAALRHTMETWAMLPGAETSHLAHGDLDVTHIYVDPDTGAYQGLIDFGEIRGSDPFYDLGQALVNVGDRRGRTVFDGIAAGYRDVVPVDLDFVRAQAIAIGTRALAIQLGRAPNAYRDFLARRLGELLDDGHWPPS